MIRRLEGLYFANDLTLLSHQIKDIKEKFNKLNEIGKKIGDILARINTARQAFAMLKPVWGSSLLSDSTKLNILYQC